MKKLKSDKKDNNSFDSYDENIDKQIISQLQNEIKSYTYEESLSALNKVLDKFQNENLNLNDLQSYYRKANLYLKHCQLMLDKAELEFKEIDVDF
tara:strand:- start:113 stop:397 length:285 start_codon:yes stop_codon:yes gene_type:complete